FIRQGEDFFSLRFDQWLLIHGFNLNTGAVPCLDVGQAFRTWLGLAESGGLGWHRRWEGEVGAMPARTPAPLPFSLGIPASRACGNARIFAQKSRDFVPGYFPRPLRGKGHGRMLPRTR